MNGTIRAVFLDVDDTLVDYAPAARAAFAAALGEDASYEQWLTLDHYERWLSGEFDFATMRTERMAAFLRLLGREADVEWAALFEQRRFEGLVGHYRLFDDVEPCLTALRERELRIGLITNNESLHQRDKLRRVGLDTGFDATVISGELGVAKPDQAIFAHACEAIGVEPDEAMHVGDNLVADARGARDAGLHGVWLDRRGECDPDRDPGVPVITDLAEIPTVLDRVTVE